MREAAISFVVIVRLYVHSSVLPHATVRLPLGGCS
jgi:hypothetical protein